MPDDRAWVDSLGPAFHAAVRAAEPRGRMTYADLDSAIPGGGFTSTQIETILEYLSRRGIELVENDG